MPAAAALGPAHTYERHQPERSVLYKIVQENLETFLQQVNEECGRPLPDFVEKEFREYLRCGILAHGFLRSKCESCHNEHLVAFSCKRRGFWRPHAKLYSYACRDPKLRRPANGRVGGSSRG